MNQNEIIKKTAEYVKNTLSGESSGHDWWHILRVWNNAKEILQEEKEANPFEVELAVLLHDIADYKFNDGDHSVGSKLTQKWLSSLEVKQETIDKVIEIIETISFSTQSKGINTTTLEAKITQDADRLDALGAIGIARAFATGAKFNEIFYDPESISGEYNSDINTRTKVHTVVNHFYEKLLLIKDLMNTQSAKKIAKHRHDYMLSFLEEFFLEWDGKK